MKAMILKARERAKPWVPEGFGRFREHYPDTEWPEPDAAADRTQEFLAAWNEGMQPPRSQALVLTPGLFAEWLPGCFGDAAAHFVARDYRCLRTRVRTGREIADQAQRLARQVLDWLRPDEQFIWCTHSKGGIDALWALHEHDALRERCTGLACVQLPVGRSWVIDDIEASEKGIANRVLRAGFRLPFVAAGLNAVSARRDPQTAAWLQALEPPVPMLHAVSWSVTPTSLIDSWHGRLNALRPGHAHDGQFFLADQRHANAAIVCLPRLDHAQPVLGGHGLDVGRLWMSLATVTAVAAA